MRLALKIMVNALAVIITAYLLPGVHIDGALTAVIVAVVLALLNSFLKPILILLTLPITLFTLGIFLLVINAAIILLTSYFVHGFKVDGFWWALLFSIVLSIINGIFESSDRYFQRRNDNNQ